VPGDPDSLVVLTSARTEFEGNTVVAALEASGIPAKLFTGTATVLQFGQYSLDTIKVMVREADRERAAAALRAIKQDSVDIDWSEVDVGDTIDPPDAFPMCPACGFDRAGAPPGSPCPECGYAGIAANRRTPIRRSPFRVWILRAGSILLVSGLIASVFGGQRNPALVIAVLLVAVWLIVWGGKSVQNAPPRRGGSQ
jgi:hypothetical protein